MQMEANQNRFPKRNANAKAYNFTNHSNSFSNQSISRKQASRKLGLTKDRNSMSKRLKTSDHHSRKDQRWMIMTESLIIASTDRLGPDPADLPKEVSEVLKSSFVKSQPVVNVESEWFSGSVCVQSPPPGSLPLPKFSPRPKTSCSGEVGGIDIHATNNLRSLLGI